MIWLLDNIKLLNTMIFPTLIIRIPGKQQYLHQCIVIFSTFQIPQNIRYLATEANLFVGTDCLVYVCNRPYKVSVGINIIYSVVFRLRAIVRQLISMSIVMVYYSCDVVVFASSFACPPLKHNEYRCHCHTALRSQSTRTNSTVQWPPGGIGLHRKCSRKQND